MKVFDLQEFINGKEAVTRGGKAAVFGCYNPKAEQFERVVGWVNGILHTWDETGKSKIGNHLVYMSPQKMVLFINVYQGQDATTFLSSINLFNSHSDAVQHIAKDIPYIGTFSVKVRK